MDRSAPCRPAALAPHARADRRIIAAVAAALALISARTPIAIHETWGVFRERERCYAIAAPIRVPRAGERGFASVVAGFGRDARNALFVRLSRPRASDAAVTLAIGERRFRLSARADAAWAADAAADHAIVAAMRGARSMSVATTTAGRRRFVDAYALAGAATAIDAARLACLPR